MGSPRTGGECFQLSPAVTVFQNFHDILTLFSLGGGGAHCARADFNEL